MDALHQDALLAFGFGLLLGLVVIAAEIKSLQRVASGLMALGIAAIPIGTVVDCTRQWPSEGVNVRSFQHLNAKCGQSSA